MSSSFGTTALRGGENIGIFLVPVSGSLQSARAGPDTERARATRIALAGMLFLRVSCSALLGEQKPRRGVSAGLSRREPWKARPSSCTEIVGVGGVARGR